MSTPQQISRDCRVCSGEQIEQMCDVHRQALASCHAMARRVLDDMKRGAIDRRIPASVRWAVSAGCPREFPCTASSARCPMAGHHLSAAFLVQPHSRVSAQVALPNVSGSITGTLPRALWLAYGPPQSSFTISSSQVRPVTAFYDARGRAGGDRSTTNELVLAMCPFLDIFPRKSVLLCGRFMAPRAIGRGGQPEQEQRSSTRRGEHSAAAPTRISTRSLPRQLPTFEGRYRRSTVPRVAADSRSPTATDDRGDARYRAMQSA